MNGRAIKFISSRQFFKRNPLGNPSNRSISSYIPEPYILPRLVIDLDATDNKFVRRYEEMTKEEQDALQSWPRRKNPSSRNTKGPQRPRNFQERPIVTQTASVTQYDLLAYALLGSQTSFGHGKVKKLLRLAGARRGDTLETEVQTLAAMCSVDDKSRLKESNSSNIQHRQMEELLSRRPSWDALERLLYRVSSTMEGCEVLSTDATASGIVASIRAVDTTSSVEFGKSNLAILRLINNLHRRMELKGVEIGSHLCNAGAHYALRAAILPALKMYVEIAIQNSYPVDLDNRKAATELLQSSRDTDNRGNPGLSSNESPQQRILILLRSWMDGDPPVSSDHSNSV